MAESTNPRSGCTGGTSMVSTALEKRSSPRVVITIGAARCARWYATSLATSSAFEPPSPTAHTRINGSVQRSMCFLSSAMSDEIDW